MAESKKNHGQRIDALEGAVGTMQNELSEIKEDIHNIFQRLDQLVRLHDDAAHNASSSAGSKGKGVMVSPRVEVTPEFQGTNSFTGLRHDFRLRKLDMPAFNGENPDGWILRAERYFTINQFTNAEKIEAAVISFEGEALSWFQWENRRRTIDRWDEMKHLLLKQFRTAQNGTLYEQWLNLEQGGGSVREYNKSFIDLSAPLENISEEIALGNFISGLRTDIRAELRLLEPINLGRAMDLAQKIEEKMQAQNSVMTQKSSFENSGNSAWLNNANTRTASTGTDETRQHPGIGATAKPAGEVRRLSESELQRRRVNGLCFRCDERWGPGHRCRQRELSALLIEEDEGGGTEELEEQKEAEPTRI